VFRLIVPSAF